MTYLIPMLLTIIGLLCILQFFLAINRVHYSSEEDAEVRWCLLFGISIPIAFFGCGMFGFGLRMIFEIMRVT